VELQEIRNEVIPWGVEVHIYIYTDVGTYCTKLETYLTPKGPKAIFRPFLKFGQATVKAIFIKNS
jgi:hypothetical protein